MMFDMPLKSVKSRQALAHDGLRMLALDGIAAIPEIQEHFYRHKLPFHWVQLGFYMVEIGSQDDLGFLIVVSDSDLEEAAQKALKRLIEE